jgi:hypothetical protein
MGYRTIGSTLAEWDDAAPFVFKLSEVVGPPDARRSTSITVDLSDLRKGFTDNFLMHLKDQLIDWRTRILLTTIESSTNNYQISSEKQ